MIIEKGQGHMSLSWVSTLFCNTEVKLGIHCASLDTQQVVNHCTHYEIIMSKYIGIFNVAAIASGKNKEKKMAVQKI